jgi:hypothetical protein
MPRTCHCDWKLEPFWRDLIDRCGASGQSVVASVKRHGMNPWACLTHVLTELPARPAGGDLADLLPDVWGRSRSAS